VNEDGDGAERAEADRASALPGASMAHGGWSDADLGFLVGILVGEGHFGGDGRQPHVTLRMHVRHEPLFRWLVRTFGGRLYGPYVYERRAFYQWMARGPFLREVLIPLLDAQLRPDRDVYATQRYRQMKTTYGLDRLRDHASS
jgi:hypothetical protein